MMPAEVSQTRLDRPWRRPGAVRYALAWLPGLLRPVPLHAPRWQVGHVLRGPLFRAGETLRLLVAGRWMCPRNPLTGQFPAAYQRGPARRRTDPICTVHWGPERQARLLVPVIP